MRGPGESPVRHPRRTGLKAGSGWGLGRLDEPADPANGEAYGGNRSRVSAGDGADFDVLARATPTVARKRRLGQASEGACGPKASASGPRWEEKVFQ